MSSTAPVSRQLTKHQREKTSGPPQSQSQNSSSSAQQQHRNVHGSTPIPPTTRQTQSIGKKQRYQNKSNAKDEYEYEEDGYEYEDDDYEYDDDDSPVEEETDNNHNHNKHSSSSRTKQNHNTHYRRAENPPIQTPPIHGANLSFEDIGNLFLQRCMEEVKGTIPIPWPVSMIPYHIHNTSTNQNVGNQTSQSNQYRYANSQPPNKHNLKHNNQSTPQNNGGNGNNPSSSNIMDFSACVGNSEQMMQEMQKAVMNSLQQFASSMWVGSGASNNSEQSASEAATTTNHRGATINRVEIIDDASDEHKFSAKNPHTSSPAVRRSTRSKPPNAFETTLYDNEEEESSQNR